jgi:hypothetical protein
MAARLRDQINLKVKPADDPYLFHTITIPIVEAAIRGEIVESLDGDEIKYISRNFLHDKSEGFLPPEYDREFTSAVAGFDVTVQGLSLEQTENVVVNGVTYGRVEFEAEGDSPNKVRHP